jgi:alkylation response protein AidB-like acyl-CoA dehydrogenase
MGVIGKMAKLGFMGVMIPREFGGLGLGHIARMIMLEEIGRVSAAVANTVAEVHLGTSPIVTDGSQEQKAKWLPLLARGEKLSTLAVTEPVGGSDISGIQTTAKCEGDDYIIDGRKCFITNSHLAGVFVVVAKTGEGAKGLTAFVVQSDYAGFRPGREENKFGLRGSNTGELIFQNCRVPKENVIGKEGDGFRIAASTISNVGRPGIASAALGIIHSCLEEAVRYSKQRVLYGKPISELQAIQWKLTDIYMDYEASRLLAYHSAWLREKGGRCDAENAMTKFWATEGAVRCAKNTIDVFGAWGCMKELAPQRLLRDAELLIAGAGTSEIMRLIMARKVLTLA